VQHAAAVSMRSGASAGRAASGIIHSLLTLKDLSRMRCSKVHKALVLQSCALGAL